jgi:hypothetical protein
MKTISVIFALFLAINVFSQDDKPITKGHILIGGDINSEYSKYSDNKLFQISATPNAGYFIIDHLALGLNVPMLYYDAIGGYSIHEYSIGLGPFAKYYFAQGLFLSFQLSGSMSKEFEGSNSTDSFTSKSLSFSPGLGYAYFINSKVSIEIGFYYEYLKEYTKDTYIYSLSNNNYNVNNFKLRIGFQLYL